MRDILARLSGTAQLVLFALLPAAKTTATSSESVAAAPRESEAGAIPEPATAAPPGPEGVASPGIKHGERCGLQDDTPHDLEGALRCTPRLVRDGLGRLLDSRGELRLFFPRCLAIAAPVLLFRLKREGFSRCSVAVSDQGLLVRGRR